MNKDILSEIVENIIEAADEIKQQSNTELHYGQLLAYAECLCIIKDSCAGYDVEEIGLDFDIDKRYL